jgi:hypothetical protein
MFELGRRCKMPSIGFSASRRQRKERMNTAATEWKIMGYYLSERERAERSDPLRRSTRTTEKINIRSITGQISMDAGQSLDVKRQNCLSLEDYEERKAR